MNKGYMVRSSALLRAFVVTGALVVSLAGDAFAIRGCVSTNPTNPDDAGLNNCLSVDMRGCKTECQALNRCYNANNPRSTVGCTSQLNAYNACRRQNALNRVAPGAPQVAGVVNADKLWPLVRERKLGWSEGSGCFVDGGSSATGADSRWTSVSAGVGSVKMKECDLYVEQLLSSFYGVDRGALERNTDLRRDLGSSNEDLRQLADVLGHNFGVTVSDDVLANLNTVADVSKCVRAAAAS